MKNYFIIVPEAVPFLLLTVIIVVFIVTGCSNPTSSNDTEIDRLEELADSVNPGILDDFQMLSVRQA